MKSVSESSSSPSPIFVVGSPRSGTTLLYHMLVSTGLFLDYRAETHFFDLFLPRYGDPSGRRRRERLADAWLASTYHVRTGIDRSPIRKRLLEEGTSPGRFLSLIMSEAALRQSRPRWADCTPAHVLYMDAIKREIPSALFLHVVRDGRDVALSLAPRGWVRPLPWDRKDPVLVAAWAWQRLVEVGRRLGSDLGPAYREVAFEDLVRSPGPTLDGLSDFVGVPLGLEQIGRSPVGSVLRPNTTFADAPDQFDPVERWRTRMEQRDLQRIEATVGSTLLACGYRLQTSGRSTIGLDARYRVARLRSGAQAVLRDRTPLGRLLADPGGAAPPDSLPEERTAG